MADRTVRDYLIEKYGAKPNGEPDVDLKELMNKTNYKKTITLHVAPYPESMVKLANEILERKNEKNNNSKYNSPIIRNISTRVK